MSPILQGNQPRNLLCKVIYCNNYKINLLCLNMYLVMIILETILAVMGRLLFAPRQASHLSWQYFWESTRIISRAVRSVSVHWKWAGRGAEDPFCNPIDILCMSITYEVPQRPGIVAATEKGGQSFPRAHDRRTHCSGRHPEYERLGFSRKIPDLSSCRPLCNSPTPEGFIHQNPKFFSGQISTIADENITQLQSALAELPARSFGPTSVKNCIDNSQNHLRSVNWESVILHFNILHRLQVQKFPKMIRGRLNVGNSLPGQLLKQ